MKDQNTAIKDNHNDIVSAGRGSHLTDGEVTTIVDFIRTRRNEFTNKSACFTAALEASGAKGKIKNNSVAVQRYYAKAEGKKTTRRSKRLVKLRLGKSHPVKPVAQRIQVNFCPNCGCNIHAVATGMAMAQHLN